MRQAGLFGLSAQLKRLSDGGDPLETLSRVVDFEAFRPMLEATLAYADGAKGGQPCPQHGPPRLPRTTRSHGIGAPERQEIGHQTAQNRPEPAATAASDASQRPDSLPARCSAELMEVPS